MKYKDLVLTRLEELEDQLRNLDRMYRVAATPYEKNEIYDRVKEKLGDIRTLINSEHAES